MTDEPALVNSHEDWDPAYPSIASTQRRLELPGRGRRSGLSQPEEEQEDKTDWLGHYSWARFSPGAFGYDAVAQIEGSLHGVGLVRGQAIDDVLPMLIGAMRWGFDLLSRLYHEVIQADQMQKGFRNLLSSVDDLKLDVPAAEDDLGLFLARAVVEDILPAALLLQRSPCGQWAGQ
ncbi:hypothetical protein ABBQ38_012223 [Trebouxia sp. C0009 RCD-2024]